MVQTEEEKKAWRREYRKRPEVIEKNKAACRKRYYNRTPEQIEADVIKGRERMRKHMEKPSAKLRSHNWWINRTPERKAQNAARVLAYDKMRTSVFKREVLAHYSDSDSPKCVRCGFNDLRALQLDHIDGRGREERRLNPAGRHGSLRWYKHLKEKGFPAGYQTLCANCNQIKVFENREMSHSFRKRGKDSLVQGLPSVEVRTEYPARPTP